MTPLLPAPDDFDGVFPEVTIGCEDRHAFHDCLRNDQAVKGILVM
jgi:hypothetical protein